MACTLEPPTWSCDTGQQIPCFDSCQLTMIWTCILSIKDNQGELHTCCMICNLHWCYSFCTGVTLFALVLHFLHFCTGVTLFALALHFLQWCYTFCTGITLFALVLHFLHYVTLKLHCS